MGIVRRVETVTCTPCNARKPTAAHGHHHHHEGEQGLGVDHLARNLRGVVRGGGVCEWIFLGGLH